MPAARTQKIEFKDLENNPGILPFKLGNVRIQLSRHTFLHKIALDKLELEIQKCGYYLNEMDEILKRDTAASSYFNNTKNINYAQLHKLVISFKLIKPSANFTSRSKRGLINGLGNIIKYITGNMDNTDQIRIEDSLKRLSESQSNIMRSFNQHLSLNKKAIQTVESNLKSLTENQQKIATAVTNLRNDTARVKNIIDTQRVFGNLEMSIIQLQEIVDQIQLALTFANLNVLHPSIINNDEAQFMLDTLSQIHDSNMFYSNDHQSFLNTITISYYITGEHIVFALHVALLHPYTYQYYKLYSIPTTRNTTIIPPTTYVAISGDFCEYISQPCKLINQNYYCPKEAISFNYQEEKCISHLLHIRENPLCTAVPVSISQSIVEQITEAKYIIIAPNRIRVKAKCKSEEIKNLQGIFLVTVPFQCMLTAKDFTYENMEEELPQEPVYLPKFNMPVAPIQPIQLNLKKVSLGELHRLTLQQEIPMQQMNNAEIWIHSSIPVYIIITALISVIAVYWYCCHFNQKPQHNTGQDDDVEREVLRNQRSCVFFTRHSQLNQGGDK